MKEKSELIRYLLGSGPMANLAYPEERASNAGRMDSDRDAWNVRRLYFFLRIRLGVVYIFASKCVILPLLVWFSWGGCDLKIVRSHKLCYVCL